MPCKGERMSEQQKRKISESERGVKKRITPEGRKVRSEHGRRVLQAWKDRTPGQGKITHGLSSQSARKRYTDLRTREGQQLKQIMDNFVTDLGGPEALDQRQQVLLGVIQTKMICVLMISDYVDRHIEKTDGLISEDGDLLPILSRQQGSFLSYTESLMKDLERLYEGNKASKNTRIPTIAELIAKDKVKK